MKGNKCILGLLIMNILDGVLTYLGMKWGFIEEANPLLSGWPPLIILISKVLLSVFLWFLWRSGFSFEGFIKYLFVFAALLYGGVLLTHVRWIAFVIFFH